MLLRGATASRPKPGTGQCHPLAPRPPCPDPSHPHFPETCITTPVWKQQGPGSQGARANDCAASPALHGPACAFVAGRHKHRKDGHRHRHGRQRRREDSGRPGGDQEHPGKAPPGQRAETAPRNPGIQFKPTVHAQGTVQFPPLLCQVWAAATAPGLVIKKTGSSRRFPGVETQLAEKAVSPGSTEATVHAGQRTGNWPSRQRQKQK